MIANRGLVNRGIALRGIAERGIAFSTPTAEAPFDPLTVAIQSLYDSEEPATAVDETTNEYDALYVDNACYEPDGVADYIAVASLTGSETVTSSYGTSTPSISAGRIDFTAGTCAMLELSNGSIYPLCENSGLTAYDIVNGADGTLNVGAGGEASARAGRTGEFAYMPLYGGTKVLDESGTTEIAVSGLVGTEVITNNGTATVTPSAGKLTISGGWVQSISIDGTPTYNLSAWYGTTVPAVSGASFGDGTLTGGAALQFPALADGTDDVAGLGLLNPPARHNGGVYKIQQAFNRQYVEFSGSASYGESANTTLGAGDFFYRWLGKRRGSDTGNFFSDGGTGSGGKFAGALLNSDTQATFYLDDNITLQSKTLAISAGSTDMLETLFWREGTGTGNVHVKITNHDTGLSYEDTFAGAVNTDFSSSFDCMLNCNKRTDGFRDNFLQSDTYLFEYGTSADNITGRIDLNDASGSTAPDSIGTNDMALTSVSLATETLPIAVNMPLGDNLFWSADGITFDAKTYEDFKTHLDGYEYVWNIWSKVGNLCVVDKIITTPPLTADQWDGMDGLRTPACSAGRLIPYPVSSGGIGPGGTYYTYDGTHVYLVEDA